MNTIVFTQRFCNRNHFYPFSLTRRVQDFRVGMMTIREKWQKILNARSFDLEGEDELPFETVNESDINSNYYLISSDLLPTAGLLKRVKKLRPGVEIIDGSGNIIVKYHKKGRLSNEGHQIKLDDQDRISFAWDIFRKNASALSFDFSLMVKGRRSAVLDNSNKVSDTKKIFVEKGAVVKHAMINADDGPVYISKDALVMEGSLLRGPLFIGEGAVVKMGAKIYGATTIGPGCTVGGEIKNTVLFGHSNKAHDGYLGDAVIGEWCNMGAGTSNSNLKNTASDITVTLPAGKFNAGLKCGVLMGDHSRTAINTAINSGTVIGVSANVFGNGLTPKLIMSFSWGFGRSVRYRREEALKDAANWKQLKSQLLSDNEKTILKKIYNNKKQIL